MESLFLRPDQTPIGWTAVSAWQLLWPAALSPVPFVWSWLPNRCVSCVRPPKCAQCKRPAASGRQERQSFGRRVFHERCDRILTVVAEAFEGTSHVCGSRYVLGREDQNVHVLFPADSGIGDAEISLG